MPFTCLRTEQTSARSNSCSVIVAWLQRLDIFESRPTKCARPAALWICFRVLLPLQTSLSRRNTSEHRTVESPKPEVADIFRRYGEAYRQKFGASLSTAQRRVMTAIEVCRTAALGGHIEVCDHCGQQRLFFNSCSDRHCPKCQSLARAEWIENRQSELLHVPLCVGRRYVVFTAEHSDLSAHRRVLTPHKFRTIEPVSLNFKEVRYVR